MISWSEKKRKENSRFRRVITKSKTFCRIFSQCLQDHKSKGHTTFTEGNESYKPHKKTGFKSLRVNYWVINQVTSKCQMDFLEKTSWLKLEKVNTIIEFCILELA